MINKINKNTKEYVESFLHEKYKSDIYFALRFYFLNQQLIYNGWSTTLIISQLILY